MYEPRKAYPTADSCGQKNDATGNDPPGQARTDPSLPPPIAALFVGTEISCGTRVVEMTRNHPITRRMGATMTGERRPLPSRRPESGLSSPNADSIRPPH